MENPKTRGPIEDAARRYAAVAEVRGDAHPTDRSNTVNLRSRLVLVAVAFGVMPTLPLVSAAQVTSNVLRRTLLIRVPAGNAELAYGTAFTIEVEGRQYLITAKHIVESLKKDQRGTIEIQKKAGWSPLKVTVLKCHDPVDIAVLIPQRQITVDLPLPPGVTGLAVGQDAYFVGFPYGPSFAKTYPNLPEVFGFVKKATVAQFDFMPEQHAQRILLDAHNNPGFSGSPLIFRDLRQPGLAFEIAGVVVSYQSDVSPVLRKRQVPADEITAEDKEQGRWGQEPDGSFYRLEETGELVQLNTGIAVAWDIGPAVDLIHRHASGPKVSDSFTGE